MDAFIGSSFSSSDRVTPLSNGLSELMRFNRWANTYSQSSPPPNKPRSSSSEYSLDTVCIDSMRVSSASPSLLVINPPNRLCGFRFIKTAVKQHHPAKSHCCSSVTIPYAFKNPTHVDTAHRRRHTLRQCQMKATSLHKSILLTTFLF